MAKTNRWWIAGVFLILAGIAMVGCQSGGGSPTPETEAESITQDAGPIAATVIAVPAQWVEVRSPVDSQVKEILVSLDDEVTAGQELVRLNDQALQVELAQVTADLLQAEATLAELKAQPLPEKLAAAEAELADAEADLDLLERARGRESEIKAAQKRIDSAQTSFTKIQEGADSRLITAAEAAVQAAKSKSEYIQSLIEQSTIKAPTAGRIIEIYTHTDEPVKAGSPFLLLADLAHLQIETTDLSEMDVVHVQVGDVVQVSFDAFPGSSFSGAVDSIASQPTKGTVVTYKVVISLDAPPNNLRWGMRGFATITK